MELDPHRRGIVIFIALLLLYLIEVPGLSLAARLAINLFLVGALLRKELGMKGEPIAESLFLSVLATVAFGLLIGNVLPVADFVSRLAFVALLGGLFVKQDMRLELPDVRRSAEARDYLWLLILGAVPFLPMFLLNPTYSLISDGWWHCSILNTIGYGSLPPQTPWAAGSSPQSMLAYPYAYHVFITYAAGGLDCFAAFNLFALITAWLAMVAVYLLAKAIYGNRNAAIAAALAVIFISNTSGIAFLFDLVTKLPELGLSGYLAFLKSVHGPQQYYGTMVFMGSQAIIPMQMATMMNGLHLMGLAFLLYFLSRRETIPAGLSLALLAASNPVMGVMGAILAGLYLCLVAQPKDAAKELAVMVAICVAVDFNYLVATLSRLGMVGGSLASGSAAFWPGYFVAFLPLMAISIFFFGKQKTTPDQSYLLLSLPLAALAGCAILPKGVPYIATDFILFYAICCAWFFQDIAKLRKEWKSALPPLALALLLAIPVFLVTGSYAYYKIPLSSDELAAAAWIRQNTAEGSVFLASVNLADKANLSASEINGINSTNLTALLPSEIDIHQYVPVFGKRSLYFGDPYLLYVYGEDFSKPMALHQRVFHDNEVCEGVDGTGIGYIYANNASLFFGEPLPDCVSEAYENEGVRIYAVNSSALAP